MRSRSPHPALTSTPFVVALFLIAPGPTATQEQGPAEVPPGREDLVGQRVRVHLLDQTFPLVGVVTNHDGTTLRLLDETRVEHTVHTTDMASLWRSTGKDDQALRGLALGGVGGAGLGAMIGALAVLFRASERGCTLDLPCDIGLDDGFILRSALIGGAVGVPLGGIIGALRSREGWVVVPTDRSPSLRAVAHPTANGRWIMGVTVMTR